MTATEQRLRKLEHRVDELEETLEVMSDRKLLKSIQRGFEDLRKGRYRKYSDARSLFKEIDSKP